MICLRAHALHKDKFSVLSQVLRASIIDKMLQEESLRPDSPGPSSHMCLVKVRLTLKFMLTLRKYVIIYPFMCVYVCVCNMWRSENNLC